MYRFLTIVASRASLDDGVFRPADLVDEVAQSIA
jgi:hypothetical protein